MNLEQRINAFVKLGEFLGQFSSNGMHKNENVLFNDLFFDGFKHQIKIAQEHNGWFTNENIIYALEGWSNTLNNNIISEWLERYNFNAFQNEAFQYQMSNANPYPRQIPAFASVANDFEPWTMKDQMLEESLNFGDIAQDIQDTLNASIVEFLQNYNSVDND